MHIWLKIAFWRRPMVSITYFKELFICEENSTQWFNSGWEKALRKNGRISSKLLNIANTNNHPLIKSAIWGLTMIVIYTSETLNSGSLIWLDFRKIFVCALLHDLNWITDDSVVRILLFVESKELIHLNVILILSAFRVTKWSVADEFFMKLYLTIYLF